MIVIPRLGKRTATRGALRRLLITSAVRAIVTHEDGRVLQPRLSHADLSHVRAITDHALCVPLPRGDVVSLDLDLLVLVAPGQKQHHRDAHEHEEYHSCPRDAAGCSRVAVRLQRDQARRHLGRRRPWG